MSNHFLCGVRGSDVSVLPFLTPKKVEIPAIEKELGVYGRLILVVKPVFEVN